jgi:formate hydrogenlyase subunit 3/multisubunit Na+/H+ antiporter MnhD subunit
MSSGWMLTLPALPLALACLGRIDGHRWLPVLAALGGAVVALLLPVGSNLDLPWLLLGVHLGYDATARLFLAFSMLAWLLAALYRALSADEPPHARRFTLFFLLAMAGNMLLVLAADMLTFYVGFALMGLAAYALLPGGSQRARLAARVYLGFTLVGELLLFAAIAVLYVEIDSLRLADLAGTDVPPLAAALLLLGFGIKVALPGLHPWLPMVYATAPAVAVAVLSGPMMKAGLLGWLRFLPPGGVDPSFASGLLILGTLGVLLGVALGLLQRAPRALLGYSSIAKMGLMSALFGVALASPQAAPAMVAALTLLAMHHLLVKGLLFLGMDQWQRYGGRPALLAGVGVLALSMMALPFSGGAAAKAALGAAFGGDIGWLFGLSAVGTTLLMARLLVLLHAGAARGPARLGAAGMLWFAALPAAFWAPFWPASIVVDTSTLPPLLLGLALFAVLAWLLRGRSLPAPAVGDIGPAVRQLWCLAHRRWRTHGWAALWVGIRQGAGAVAMPQPSLLLPGLALLVLMAVLLIALLIPS